MLSAKRQGSPSSLAHVCSPWYLEQCYQRLGQMPLCRLPESIDNYRCCSIGESSQTSRHVGGHVPTRRTETCSLYQQDDMGGSFEKAALVAHELAAAQLRLFKSVLDNIQLVLPLHLQAMLADGVVRARHHPYIADSVCDKDAPQAAWIRKTGLGPYEGVALVHGAATHADLQTVKGAELSHAQACIRPTSLKL